MARKRRKFSDDPMVRLIREHGYREVQRAANYAVGWAYVTSKLGHDATFTEYWTYFPMPERSAARQSVAFQKVTGMKSPRELVDLAKRLGYEVRPDLDPADGLALVALAAA